MLDGSIDVWRFRQSGFGARPQQKCLNFVVFANDCRGERSSALFILCVDIGPIGEQRLHYIGVSVIRGKYQRTLSACISGIDVGPVG